MEMYFKSTAVIYRIIVGKETQQAAQFKLLLLFFNSAVLEIISGFIDIH